MHKDKIINLGGMFNYIGKKFLNLYKMVSKKIVESITLILTNSTGDDLIDYKIYGNSEQTSDPSPENPQEIKSVGDLVESGEHQGKYKIPVVCSGKNLFNGLTGRTEKTLPSGTEVRNFTGNGIYRGLARNNLNNPNSLTSYTIYNDNSFKASIGSAYYGLAFDFILKPNTDYILSYNSPQNDSIVGAGFYDKDGNYLDNDVSAKNGFTTPSNCKYTILSFTKQNAGEVEYSDIQLEEGTTSTECELYHESITTNIYLDEPLSKIGDYKDEILKPSGKNIFNYDEFIREANAIGSGYAELTTYLNTNVLRYRNSIPSLQFMKGKFKENTRYTFKTAVARSNWVSEGSNAPFLNITYTDGTNDSLNCSSTENSFTVSTFTSQANKTIDYIKVSDYSGSQKINLNLSVTQLEEGTSATEYEPYGVGVWYLKKNIGKDILNGSETWNLQNVTSGKNYYTKINSALADSGVPSYSNISKYRYFGTIEQNVPQYSSYISNGKNFNILADIFNDTSALQTFLNNTNMILYYVLATPTYTPLDLPSIPTFEGTTIITFGTEVQPSNAWVKYYAEEE